LVNSLPLAGLHSSDMGKESTYQYKMVNINESKHFDGKHVYRYTQCGYEVPRMILLQAYLYTCGY